MKDINWIEVSKSIFDTNGNIRPLLIDGRYFEFAIIGHQISRVGFMTIWDIETQRAVWLSRVDIPEGMKFRSFEDEDQESIIPRNLQFEDIITNKKI